MMCAQSDLNEVGAEGVDTKPGGTVDIICGETCCCILEKAKSLEGKAGFLLLSVDSHYCLTIPVTPCRGQMEFFFHVVCFLPGFSLARALLKGTFVTYTDYHKPLLMHILHLMHIDIGTAQLNNT